MRVCLCLFACVSVSLFVRLIECFMCLCAVVCLVGRFVMWLCVCLCRGVCACAVVCLGVCVWMW